MGTYHETNDRPEMPSFSQRVRGPAAWGGIGCLLAILLPVLSYFAALLTLEYNAFYHWFAIPAGWTEKPLGLPISGVLLMLTIGYMVILYGIYATVYAIMYRAVGISPYTALDLDSPARSRKRVSQAQKSRLTGVVLFLTAVLVSYLLLRAELTYQWFPIPPSWLLSGAFPYAGVYVLLLLLVWVFVWALWGIIHGIISALFFKKEEPLEDELMGDE